MRDPHVVTLRYRLSTEEAISYNDPLPIAVDTDAFSVYLAANILTITMTEHVSSVELARGRVERYLRSWELEVALRLGPGELHFIFENAEIIDRDPMANTRMMHLSASVTLLTDMSAKLHVSRSQYPTPPSRFEASPDVETMWHRYLNYKKGRETLQSMAYFCYTVIMQRPDRSKDIAVDKRVLKMLSEISSIHGDKSTARKLNAQSTLRPLTPNEINWLETALTTLIYRVGIADSNKGALPRLSMKDLPRL
jgi:hypothetical protein